MLEENEWGIVLFSANNTQDFVYNAERRHKPGVRNHENSKGDSVWL